MLLRTYEQCLKVEKKTNIIIATDDDQIENFCINNWKVKTLPNKKNEFLIQKVSKKNKKSAVLENISKKRILALF